MATDHDVKGNVRFVNQATGHSEMNLSR